MGQNTLATNQMTQFAVVMFGSIVSAVAVSTFVIMSLLGGPMTSAMTAQNNNVQSGVSANMCLDTSAPAHEEEAAPAAADAKSAGGFGVSAPVRLASRGYLMGGISGSFNTTNHNTTTTTTTNTFNNTTTKTNVIIKDNGNSYSASWNNGNTAVFAPTTNTSTTTNTSQNNGNSNTQNDNSNQGNNYSNNQSSTTNTSNTSNTVSTVIQDNGNTNNQNNGNTAVNVSDNGNTNNQDNNSNQNNDNSSNHHNDGGLL